MNGKQIIVLIFLLCAGLTSLSHADSFYYYYFANGQLVTDPCLVIEWGSVLMIGYFDFETPAKGVRFSAPLPPCVGTVYSETVNFNATGDLSTGISTRSSSNRHWL
jgi:hypothetical protein